MTISNDDMISLCENENKLKQEYDALKASGASTEQLWVKAQEIIKANQASNDYACKHVRADD
ncbi:hypothetical protein ACET5X_05825 [Aeromonas veronii]